MTASRVYKTEGIILKRKNIGEADRMLTVFTREYGKIRVIAKGIRKISSRRAPHLEPFTRVAMVVYRGKTLDSVSEVQPLAIYEDIRHDLERVSIAYYLCELVESLLAEKQEHAEVFLMFSQALSELGESRAGEMYRMSKAFTLALLWELGFLPRTQSLNGEALQDFIETITERKLKSTHFARQLLSAARA